MNQRAFVAHQIQINPSMFTTSRERRTYSLSLPPPLFLSLSLSLSLSRRQASEGKTVEGVVEYIFFPEVLSFFFVRVKRQKEKR
jgi:hypothetical protein